MTAEQFAQRIPRARQHEGQWIGCCPAHDDRHESLSWRNGHAGLLVTCHAGCPKERIAEALHVDLDELFGRNGSRPVAVVPPPASPVGREVAHYDYHSARGALLYQVVRYEPKSFRQRRPNGKGGWLWSMIGVERVVYRLPELAEQTKVLWLEGERDVDTAVALGFTATTSPGGASAFDPKYVLQVAEAGIREVVLLPDNDEPGRAYAHEVAAACHARGLDVRMLALPGLAIKGDLSDWVVAGGTAAALRALVEQAPRWRPPSEAIADGLTVEATGGEYVVSWDNSGAVLRFFNVLRADGGLSAEVDTIIPGSPPVWNRLLMASPSSRRDVVRDLADQRPGPPWSEILPIACRRVRDREAEGAAVLELDAFPAEASPHWLVDRWIPLGGSTVIYGDGESLKSCLMLALALAALQGGELVDGDASWAIRRCRSVLFLDWEEPDPLIVRQRMAALCRAQGLDRTPPGFHYKPMDGPLLERIPAIRAEVAQRATDLLIVDSMMPACGGNPADAEISGRFFRALRLFAPATNLVLGHIPKSMASGPTPDGGMPTIFGSAFHRYLARSAIYVSADDLPDPSGIEGRVITLVNTKNNHWDKRLNPPRALRVTFTGPQDAPTISVTRGGAPDITSASVFDKIRQAMRSGAKTGTAIADHTGLSPDTIRRTLNRAENRDLVERKGPGLGGRGRESEWILKDEMRDT